MVNAFAISCAVWSAGNPTVEAQSRWASGYGERAEDGRTAKGNKRPRPAFEELAFSKQGERQERMMTGSHCSHFMCYRKTQSCEPHTNIQTPNPSLYSGKGALMQNSLRYHHT